MRKFLLFTGLLFSTISVWAQEEKTDLAIINKIIQEGTVNSQIMNIAFHLTDVSGPRLTNSPGYYRAANYAVSQLKKWGADKAGLEAWGDFGQGWQLKKSYIAMTAPYYKPLLAYPKTWTAGTKGLKKGNLLVIALKDSAALMAYKGKLKGKLIIIDQMNVYKQSFKADAVRYTDEELAKMAAATPQAGGRRQPTDTAQMRQMREQFARSGAGASMRVTSMLKTMAMEEGAVAMLSTSTRNHDGTIFAQGGGTYKGTD